MAGRARAGWLSVISHKCYLCGMSSDRPAAAAGDQHRERIVDSALRLLTEQGRDAVSTRAVSAAAGVQAPVIYRLFGDKRGLLDAVATRGFAAHLAVKRQLGEGQGPVEALRAGWDLNISFALANPALYALIWGEPHPGAPMAAELLGHQVLRDAVRRVAEAGRLRVPEDLAAQMLHAAGRGTALALLSQPEDRREGALSEANREAVVAALVTGEAPQDSPAPQGDPVAVAIALRALLPGAAGLTDRERLLLEEWLDRIARP